MSECIVCNKPLSKNEMYLNMDFHTTCAPDVIKTALDFLGWTSKKDKAPAPEVKE